MTRLAYYPDAQEYLATSYTLRRVHTFCDEIHRIGPREIDVRIQRLKGLDRWWFGVLGKVCPVEIAHAPSALRYNIRLALGALAAEDTAVWLRVVIPSPTTPETLDEAIVYVGEEVARILDIPPLPDSGELFSNLAD